MLAATGIRLNELAWGVGFIGLQIFLMSILLYLTRILLKFSWIKSLWISAGFASIGSLLFHLLVTGRSPSLDLIYWGILPILIVAAVTIIRAIVNCLGAMDDGGNVNSAERQRTLDMVEQGKITAEEGAELLEALGRSNAMLGQDRFSRLDMLILAGIAITVFGFFLPWVEIDVLNLGKLISQQQNGLYNPFGFTLKNVHNGKFGYLSGYHAGAIGWAVLIVGVLATIPVFITPKNFLYKVSMLQIFLLLLDCALVISMLICVGGKMAVGLPVCLVGLALASVACFGKFKKLAA